MSYDPLGPHKVNWMYLLMVVLTALGIAVVVICAGYGVPSREFWER